MKFIAFDTETGGIDPKNSSLLSVYMAVLDENFNCLDGLELNIKNESNEPYKVTAEALKINGINLQDIHKKGESRGLASIKISDFITKHSNNGKDKLVPIGHNVVFDISFIQEHLVTKELWDKYVSYRVLDTATIANFLKLKDIIPSNISISLKSLAKFFDIDLTKGTLHSAKFDTIVTTLILEKMLKL